MIFVSLGIFLILFGTGLLFHPAWYSAKYSRWFDFTGYNVPFGCFCILIGILFIWSEVRKHIKKKKESQRPE
jgi:uncharacterized membrane protein